MNVVRKWPWLIAITLLLPTALAAPGLTAASLTLAGDTEMSGDASALFARAQGTPFEWELTALAGEFRRYSATTLAIESPLNPDHPLFQSEPEWTIQNETLTSLTMISKDITADGALLVLSDDATVEAFSDGLVALHSISDPRIAQAPQDAAAPGADDGYIRHQLTGNFLNATFSDGEMIIRGDIDLILYGPTYTLSTPDGSREEQSGAHESQRTAVKSDGTMERHVYTLHDAVLRIRTPTRVELYTRFPEIAFSGTLQAASAEGALDLGGAEVPVSGNGVLTWAGVATVQLTAAGDRILATTPVPVATAGGAIVRQGPPAALFLIGGSAVAAIAAITIFLARRKAHTENDLDIAILAMEEHRWEDAIPRLSRLAKKEPENASVQIDRALCLEQVGRFPDASKAFEAALRVQPTNAEAHFYYARTLAKMREREAARVHLETALEGDPRLVEMVRAETVLKGL